MAFFPGFHTPGTLQPSEIKTTDPIWSIIWQEKIFLVRRSGILPGSGIPVNYDLFNSQGVLIAGVRQVFPNNTYNNLTSFYFNISDLQGNTLLIISRDRQVTNVLMPSYSAPSCVRNIGCCVKQETNKGKIQKLLGYSQEAQALHNPDSIPQTFAHVRKNINGGFSVINRAGLLGADIVFSQRQFDDPTQRFTISTTFRAPHQGFLALRPSKEFELTATQRAIVLAQIITIDYDDGYEFWSNMQPILLNRVSYGHPSYQEALNFHDIRYRTDSEYRKTVDEYNKQFYAIPHQPGHRLR
jgi:hypothetical protein